MPVLSVAGKLIPRSLLKKHLGSKRRKIKRSKPGTKLKRSLSTSSRINSQSRTRNWQLYVLRLEHSKYYVGITAYKDVQHRYLQHISGKGAAWARLYKPVEIIEKRPLGMISEREALKTETATTIQYMKAYGMDNVRGGVLCLTNPKTNSSHYNRYTEVKVRPNLRHDPIFNELRWLLTAE